MATFHGAFFAGVFLAGGIRYLFSCK